MQLLKYTRTFENVIVQYITVITVCLNYFKIAYFLMFQIGGPGPTLATLLHCLLRMRDIFTW